MLGGALAAVTMLLVMLLALSAGLRDTLIRNATTLSAGHINVAGFFKAKTRDSAPIVTGLSELRRIVEASQRASRSPDRTTTPYDQKTAIFEMRKLILSA